MDGGRIRTAGVLLLAALTACAESPLEPEALDLDGIWRLTEAGVFESTIRLSEDGSFDRVTADLVLGSCRASSGRWSEDMASLTLVVTLSDNMPTSERETYSVSLDSSGLRLTGSSSDGLYREVTAMPDCVDYGFGDWTGLLTAEIDGVDVVFSVVEVSIDIDGGEASILGEDTACSSCPDGRREILLRIDSQPDPLTPGTFDVDNDPGAVHTFYGLYNPDPASSTFIGFDTTRLAPPGTFALSSIGVDRVVGTFDFRANPRVEGQTGPNGETFATVGSGRVDLAYR